MTIVNGYTDAITLKAYLGNDLPSLYDVMIDSCVNSASRAIDAYCQRRFWLDPTAVARTFVPDNLIFIDLDESDTLGGDIGDASSVTIATDPSGTGNFTVAWQSSDFHLLPNNAAVAWPEARPYTAVRAVGTKTFPWLVNTWLTRLDRVQITAKWGWPAVPNAVTQACLIKGARLFHRKDSPQGVAGYGDFGPVRLSKGEDPDVCSLLDDYRRTPIMVA